MPEKNARGASLPSVISDSQLVGNKTLKMSHSEASKCVICRDYLSARAVLDPCLHEFDFLCIDTWTQSHDTCPICRQFATSILYDIIWNTEFSTKPVFAQVEEDSEEEDSDEELNQIEDAMENLRDAMEDLDDAMEELEDAINEDSVEVDSEEQDSE